MNDAETCPTGSLDEVLQLSSVAWLAAQRASAALGAAAGVAPLVDLAAAVAPPELAAELRAIDRAVAVATDAAEKARAESARAADALGAATAAVATGDTAALRTAGRTIELAMAVTNAGLSTTFQQAAIAGRIAAGIAALFEPGDGDEPLWHAAKEALRTVPIATSHDQVGVTLDGTDRDRVLVAGFLTHATIHQPTFVIASPDDPGDERYVQVMIDDERHVESIADTFLEPEDRLREREIAALAELGYAPPDEDEVNWWLDSGPSVTDVGDLLLATLRRVHGVADGDTIVLAASLAAQHPLRPRVPNPSDLAVAEPTIDAVAAVLAERLREGIDTVGLDRLWVTVGQESSPYIAHLGSNFDGQLFTEVTGDFYLDVDDRLDATQVARLRALGWEDPIDDESDDEELQPRNHTRVWPAPVDVDAAAWHVVLTLVTVYGVELDETWIATAEPI